MSYLRRNSRSSWLLGSAAVFFMITVATAFGAVGDLTPQGCVDDNDTGPETCAVSGDGLGGGAQPAVSPDGRSVYGVSFVDDSIVTFDRNPTTGALTYRGCIDDNDTGADDCATAVDGLDQPRGIAISPDGTSVYVTNQIDDSIVRFDRNGTTGALTYRGCIDDNGPGEGPDNCATATSGLNGAIEVDVSPDGSSVYVVSAGDHAIVTFNRAAGGALTPAGCIEDDDTGTDAACPKVPALAEAAGVEVSGDGKSVYVASFGDDAVARFARATGGALTAQGCVDDDETGPDTCADSADGLEAAVGLTVTP
ncbi:MAG: lactonase family protein, partial [Solirubrobacterales bacterium]